MTPGLASCPGKSCICSFFWPRTRLYSPPEDVPGTVVVLEVGRWDGGWVRRNTVGSEDNRTGKGRLQVWKPSSFIGILLSWPPNGK